MGDCSNKLVLEVNQGCPRAFSFTLYTNSYDSNTGNETQVPLNLSDYTVVFQVKKAPYFNLKALIEKEITITSDLNTVGVINDGVNGEFMVQLNEDDVNKLPPGEYALTINLVDSGGTTTHLSGDGDMYAIYRVCYA